METLHFKKHHWRKTSQWFSLLPHHAQLVVEDEEVNDVFEKYCFPYMDLEAERYVRRGGGDGGGDGGGGYGCITGAVIVHMHHHHHPVVLAHEHHHPICPSLS